MNNLNALTVFTKVAESRSFTAAARRLRLTTSAVSKSMSRLEQELGVRLFQRSTRMVSLTNDGESFFQRCRHILAEIEDAENALTLTKAEPRGKLRVQTPVVIGRRVVVPNLVRFTEQHPGLVIDVELSDRVTDLAFEGIDVVIRLGQIGDVRLVARRLCALTFAAYASPAYLDRYGEPDTPDDLDHHRCLAYLFPMTGDYREWHFSNNGHAFIKKVSGKLNMNDADSLLEAAEAGAGITMMSNLTAADALRAGRLKQILTPYVAAGPEVYAVYLPGRYLSQKIRVFIDFLAEVLGEFE